MSVSPSFSQRRKWRNRNHTASNWRSQDLYSGLIMPRPVFFPSCHTPLCSRSYACECFILWGTVNQTPLLRSEPVGKWSQIWLIISVLLQIKLAWRTEPGHTAYTGLLPHPSWAHPLSPESSSRTAAGLPRTVAEVMPGTEEWGRGERGTRVAPRRELRRFRATHEQHSFSPGDEWVWGSERMAEVSPQHFWECRNSSSVGFVGWFFLWSWFTWTEETVSFSSSRTTYV